MRDLSLWGHIQFILSASYIGVFIDFPRFSKLYDTAYPFLLLPSVSFHSPYTSILEINYPRFLPQFPPVSKSPFPRCPGRYIFYIDSFPPASVHPQNIDFDRVTQHIQMLRLFLFSHTMPSHFSLEPFLIRDLLEVC